MRLLVVGFADNVHIARYMQLLDGTGWDLHLCTSRPGGKPHPELPELTLHFPGPTPELLAGSPVRLAPAPSEAPRTFAAYVAYVAGVIAEIRPDIIHSHEIQAGGAVVEAALGKRNMRPPWLVTSWGSDIVWWGRDPGYIQRLRRVLVSCDYFAADCHRDVALARALGLRGRVVGVWPVTGGLDPDQVQRLRRPGPTSERRAVTINGNVSTIGRGDVAYAAVERCADLLAGWEVGGYQMDADLEARYSELARRAGFTYTALSGPSAQESPYEAVLALHGRSRVSLALNLTDGLSLSFVEAMALGSLPIHGSNSGSGEIAPHGRGTLLVEPTDVDVAAAALRRALTDDALVDSAAAVNAQIVREHLDRRRNRARIIDAYERIACDATLAAA
jgi:glycosyltransferase involved in cell wall biosynthesis